MRLFKNAASSSTGPSISCEIGSGSIDFEALLRESVRSINDVHQKAVDDLLGLCQQLDAAVSGLSNEDLRIKIVEITDTPEGVAYEMRLHDRQNELYAFHMYKVPVSGYPITYGTRGSGGKFTGFEAQSLNRNALEQHFAQLLTDAQSPLVVQVSFAMRKASRTPMAIAA